MQDIQIKERIMEKHLSGSYVKIKMLKSLVNLVMKSCCNLILSLQ